MAPAEPKYMAIANDLRRRIANGEFTTGTLPSITDLEQHYGAALNTVRAAQDILENEGLIRRMQGHATRIVGDVAKEPSVKELLAQAEAAIALAGKLVATARQAG